MAAWKQFVSAIVILLAAAAGWVMFVPSSRDVLARWGIDWAQASTGKSEQTQSGNGAGGNRQGGRNGAAQTPVVTRPVSSGTINDQLSAIGTGRALNSVVINPYASGRLTEIAVKAGDKIEAGAVIAKLDSDSEEIALERARINQGDAEAALERIKALRATNTATTVQQREAELALDTAKLAVRDASLALDRRAITAPISGIVGILPVEAGNYVTSQTTIATIDDRSRIIVDFWVPERFTGLIAADQPVSANSVARPGQFFEGVVSAVDNRLEEQSRTLHIQARIDNDGDALRAGMSFQVSMRFPGDTFPSVDPLAIQWGGDGAFVWALNDGKAKRVPVRIIQRNTDTVLVDAALNSGDQVVTEGIHAVREGAALLVAGSEGAQRSGS
ncbi:efflux RND transporter periplasmic adaptor subunit [Aminobacter sp. MET-1]|uniref:efflux RND transporter periplasmic adaptor subunit n=1 Tax=Aminobacter sp. MET-1 TaxID=2951085 RepID=UPI00226A04A3|nr:efflux RND transporter periplasmic adaptor subunit [Aminobacter sp. MET-1]MCX8569714.1 efflux RND transporter periplasmic adaptor subunit [Aminobacter sp. MET-1]